MKMKRDESFGLDRLLSKLDFTPEGIAEAACEQAELFRQMADVRVSRMRKRIKAEAAVDLVRAETALAFRKDARDCGEKLTEENLKNLLATCTAIREAEESLGEAEVEEEYAKLLVEAFRMRRDSLEVVGYLAGREISSQQLQEIATAQIQGVKRKLAEKYPGSGRR